MNNKLDAAFTRIFKYEDGIPVKQESIEKIFFPYFLAGKIKCEFDHEIRIEIILKELKLLQTLAVTVLYDCESCKEIKSNISNLGDWEEGKSYSMNCEDIYTPHTT